MTTEADRELARAEQTGAIIANIENLGKNMNGGFSRGEKRFDSIDKEIKDLKILKCEPNILKITEMHTWYTEFKEFKRVIFKTSLKIILPMFLFFGGAFSVAFAYFQTP